MHPEDLEKGCGRVALPGALARKYPNAEMAWEWQYVFPAKTMYPTSWATHSKPGSAL